MPNKLQSTSDRIERLVERVFPIEGVKLAMRHFQDNFHKGGFVNGGLQPWQKSKQKYAETTAEETARNKEAQKYVDGLKSKYGALEFTKREITTLIWTKIP